MPTVEHPTTTESADESWIIPRPPAVLMELPFAFRWEVTRRHPYYLRFWPLARKHYADPSPDAARRSLEVSAALILTAIGVTGPIPEPSASPESLGIGSLSQGWESGAVAPVTFRGLVGTLLTGLPADALVQLGQLFTECGTADADPDRNRNEFLNRLFGLRHPALEACPPRPLVGVNINAPQRVIAEALEQMVRRWKEEQGLSERRRRDDKLDDYLAAWDLREGWVTDHYDGTREQTLRQIARQQRVPLSTVANRYKAAFRLIVGLDYSPSLWARVIGSCKVGEWVKPEEMPRRSLRRPWNDRQPARTVPESSLQAAGEGCGAVGLLNTAGVSPSEIGYVDLVLDVQELIEKGRSNEEIAAALELPSPLADEVIDFLRERHKDSL